LHLGNVCEARGDYEKALQYVEKYENLDWVKETDEDTCYWKGKFKEWAHLNKMATRLTSGDLSVLSNYITHLESNEDESLLTLLNVMEVANKYNYNVDEFLQRIEVSSVINQDSPNNTYTRQTIEERITRLYYELANYYLKNSNYRNGFDFFIKGMEKSVELKEKRVSSNVSSSLKTTKICVIPKQSWPTKNYIIVVFRDNVKELCGGGCQLPPALLKISIKCYKRQNGDTMLASFIFTYLRLGSIIERLCLHLVPYIHLL